MSVNLYNATTDTLKNVAGDIINVHSVNEMIAPIETGVASKAYAVDEQFIMNNILYTTTSAIAQNDSIIVGTNCQVAEKLSEQIENINADLSGLKFRNNNNIPEVSVDGGTTWIPMLSNLISQETYTLIGTSQATIIPPAGATYIRIRYNNKSDYVTPYVVINNVTSALTSNYVTYAINGNFKIKLVDQFSGNSSGFDINYYRIQP